MEIVSNLLASTRLIIPEIVISLGICLVLVFDLIYKNEQKYKLNYLTGAILLITGLFVSRQLVFRDIAFGMLVVDWLAVYFKAIVLLATFIIVLYLFTSKEVTKFINRLGEFHIVLLGMLLGMMLIVGAVDLILIYVAMETMSLSSYVLAGFDKTRIRNSEASLKYLVYGSAASGIMIFGISLIFGTTGTTNIFGIRETLTSSTLIQPILFNLGFILIFVGVAYKISAAPFHFWAPDVYEGAPITITAYLSVASKAAGFVMLIRVLQALIIPAKHNLIYIPQFDLKTIFIIFSVLSMFFGNFSALWQNNIKRLLAYSSIAHLGYILLGVIAFSETGLIAVLSYFLVYLIMNLGAFYIAMVIADNYGIEDIDDYKGLGRKTPFLAASLSIFIVSLIGLPPLAGFIPKFYLFVALVDKQMILLAIIALLNTVVSLVYYVKIMKEMYLSKPEREDLSEANLPIINKVLAILLVIPTIILGVYFAPMMDIAKNVIQNFLK